MILRLFTSQGDDVTDLLGSKGVGAARTGRVSEPSLWWGLGRRRCGLRVGVFANGCGWLAGVAPYPLAHGIGAQVESGGNGRSAHVLLRGQENDFGALYQSDVAWSVADLRVPVPLFPGRREPKRYDYYA